MPRSVRSDPRQLRRPRRAASQAVTIQQVAELARVSPKSVSRVINNEPSVREDTRIRILQAIKALKYRPNLSARSLAGNRSFLIGLFCDRPGDYLGEFQSGAVERCRESHYHLMVEPLDMEHAEVEQQVETLVGQLRLEGAILLPPLGDHEVILSRLNDAAIPIVRISPKSKPGTTPSIGIDDYLAARELTAHLLGLGHRRIGFILGRPDHAVTEQRYLGFIDEMRAWDSPVDSDLVQTGNFEFAGGLACAERMLRASVPPTAIFTSNDDTAAAVIVVARKLGLRVPGDLSVTGFDDVPIATMIWPDLTTIRQPVADMARLAVSLFIEHAPRRNGWPDPAPRHILPHKLVIRGSTGPR
jgi:LacI family transcriptional regulator